MFEIAESTVNTRNVIATAESFDAAKAKVADMGATLIDDDSDYADCADALLNDGRVVAIQPIGFKIG